MKNVIVKIFAVLLTVWYSMSVIGFDVHTCNGSGRSFVVTFIEGFTCKDIHPDHVCEKISCCGGNHEGCCSDHSEGHSEASSHDGISINAKSCCSNDYQALALTGTVSQNDHEHFDECVCGHCPCIEFPAGEIPALIAENDFIKHIPEPDSACDRQAALRVWRI